VPAGARRIDGRGRWLIPGLFDAHVHLGEGSQQVSARTLHLAFGVTSVRNMGGSNPPQLRTVADGVSNGTETGPRIFMAGRPLDGDPPKWPALSANVPLVARTPDDARRFVRDVKESNAIS
jgi:imidazolonepropionase-like amidohydrolase